MKSSVYEPSFGQDYVEVIGRSVSEYWLAYLVIVVTTLVILITLGLAAALSSMLFTLSGMAVGGVVGTMIVRRARRAQTEAIHAAYGDNARVFWSGQSRTTGSPFGGQKTNTAEDGDTECRFISPYEM